MPLQPCQAKGKKGWKWGRQGRCYSGPSGKARALRQARAIKASQARQGVANARKGKTPINTLRVDPTRTSSLRKTFAAELARRFARLRLLVADLVEKEDAFGLGVRETTIADLTKEPKQPRLVLTDNQRWRFLSTPEKVQQFTAWLRTQIGTLFRGQTVEQLWRRYIEAGFRKGAGRAFDDTRRSQRVLEEGRQPLGFYEGTRDEFLRSAFAQPVALEKVQLLAGRGLTDLAGVTEQMATVMTRTLTDGLVRGASPREVARDLVKNVDGIGRRRAELIAQTETSRAHAEGQLMALEQLRVEEVGITVEWQVTRTRDGRLESKVCPSCAVMGGVVLKIAEARGLIPRHPG